MESDNNQDGVLDFQEFKTAVRYVQRKLKKKNWCIFTLAVYFCNNKYCMASEDIFFTKDNSWDKLALLWGEAQLCLPYVCLKKEKERKKKTNTLISLHDLFSKEEHIQLRK